MKKWKVLLGILALSLCLTACGKNKEETGKTNESSTTEISHKDEAETSEQGENSTSQNSGDTDKEENNQEKKITVEMITEPKEYLAEDGTVLVSGYFKFPKITIQGDEEKVNVINSDIEALREEFETSFASYVEDAKTEFATAAESGYEFSSYYISLDIKVARNNNNIISLSEDYNDYTGGAHGNYGSIGATCNIASGEKVTLDSLSENASSFKQEVLNKLKELAKTEYYSQRLDVGYEENLESTTITEGKWYFSNSGLHLFANPYELGAYAAGKIDFVIPYEELEKIGLSSTYKYTGNFEKEAVVGTEVKKDINQDGKEESIYYQVNYQEDNGAYSYEFTVDGKDFASMLNMEMPSGEKYYLVDLDSTDKYIEIAVLDYGASDDLVTYFYRYGTDGSMVLVGSIPDNWGNGQCYLVSNGVVTGHKRLELLQTWSAPFQWKLNEAGSLVEKEEEMYFPDTSYMSANTILQNITVYKEMDLKSETVTLTPKDGKVNFVATDNKNWVEFTTEKNQTYYLYMKDFSTILSGDKELQSTDVFEKLVIAD